MRWTEITEKQNIQQNFESYALDLLIPLYKKGLEKVSFEHFKDKMIQNPDVAQGIDINDDFYMDCLTALDIIDKVEPDIDNDNMMMIWFKGPSSPNHKSSEDDAEKKTDKMKDNATDQAKKAVQGKDNPL